MHRLINFRPATHNGFVWSGDRRLPIEGYGTMTVSTGNRILLLEDVAFCPRLLTTLVSLRQLRKKGYYWDNQTNPRPFDGAIRPLCGPYKTDMASLYWNTNLKDSQSPHLQCIARRSQRGSSEHP